MTEMIFVSILSYNLATSDFDGFLFQLKSNVLRLRFESQGEQYRKHMEWYFKAFTPSSSSLNLICSVG